MGEATRFFQALEQDNADAVGRLFPVIYRELREMAAKKIASEPPGVALRPTELVHEAYSRLIGTEPTSRWDGRRHFFGAASLAMRRRAKSVSVVISPALCARRGKLGG